MNQKNVSDDKEVVDIPNKVHGFMIYSKLYDILDSFVLYGDGYRTLPVFEEDVYVDSNVIDSTVINLIKLLSTSFGLTYVEEAMTIANHMHKDRVLKKSVRFRSRHPLFVAGSQLYQNVCLISGMIHLGIPILPYFDGENMLVDVDERFQLDIDRLEVRKDE